MKVRKFAFDGVEFTLYVVRRKHSDLVSIGGFATDIRTREQAIIEPKPLETRDTPLIMAATEG